MLLKNSLKQMLRTKARMVVFMLLMLLAVTFLSLGVNLWHACNENLKGYEKVFMTVGLVNQKENTVKVTETWDAATKEYTYQDKPVYDSILPVSLLDFEGADYIVRPEQRPFYGAYTPGIKIYPPEMEKIQKSRWGSISEIVPYEDCIPSSPVRVKVTRVLWGTGNKEGEDIWLCDHFNDNPGPLKAGKKYITSIQSWPNSHSDSDPKAYYESNSYNPFKYNSSISTQTNKNGELIENNDVASENWDEVTENFYETKEGQKWIALIEAQERFTQTFPVVPISKTKLLMDFHQGNVSISRGRDITAKEYMNGEKVCIMPQGLAVKNNLKIGDKINLQLYLSNYKTSASQIYFPSGLISVDFILLNAKGETYPVFENSEYEIVGIYNGANKTNQPTGYEMGNNAVVIPENSVKNSDNNNIIAYGPMKGYTTSFQIPNGTTKAYLEKFQSLGIKNLEISFYDGGYEKLASGMRNIKMVALILMVISGATTMAILFFFIFLFITKQKKRTAIERSLGMSKKECILSMLYGILFIISIGAVTGSFAGFMITNFIMSNLKDTGVGQYSTAFSNWVNNSDNASQISAVRVSANSLMSIVLCIMVIFVSLLIAFLFIKRNIKVEPLGLLSKSEE